MLLGYNVQQALFAAHKSVHNGAWQTRAALPRGPVDQGRGDEHYPASPSLRLLRCPSIVANESNRFTRQTRRQAASWHEMSQNLLLVYIFIYTYIYSSYLDIYARGGNPQPEAIGHSQTCLQPESGANRTMHSLQPCQLGYGSLVNAVPIPPLGRCVEEPSLVTSRNSRRIEVAPVIGVSGVATTFEYERNHRNSPCLRGDLTGLLLEHA